MTTGRRVLLMLGCSRASERGLLRGIARYSRFHEPWSFYREPPFYRKPPYHRLPRHTPSLSPLRGRGIDGVVAYAAESRSDRGVSAGGVSGRGSADRGEDSRLVQHRGGGPHRWAHRGRAFSRPRLHTIRLLRVRPHVLVAGAAGRLHPAAGRGWVRGPAVRASGPIGERAVGGGADLHGGLASVVAQARRADGLQRRSRPAGDRGQQGRRDTHTGRDRGSGG